MGNYIQLGILIVAVVAAIISLVELHSHKAKENNKLLSQLNRRYLSSEDIQVVVRYLRKFDASDEEPTAYQVELFLRFFEELAVYLKTKSLKKDDVKEFFNYYFYRFETSDRGDLLKTKIKNEDSKLHYLKKYREIMGYQEV